MMRNIQERRSAICLGAEPDWSARTTASCTKSSAPLISDVMLRAYPNNSGCNTINFRRNRKASPILAVELDPRATVLDINHKTASTYRGTGRPWTVEIYRHSPAFRSRTVFRHICTLPSDALSVAFGAKACIAELAVPASGSGFRLGIGFVSNVAIALIPLNKSKSESSEISARNANSREFRPDWSLHSISELHTAGVGNWLPPAKNCNCSCTAWIFFDLEWKRTFSTVFPERRRWSVRHIYTHE